MRYADKWGEEPRHEKKKESGDEEEKSFVCEMIEIYCSAYAIARARFCWVRGRAAAENEEVNRSLVLECNADEAWVSETRSMGIKTFSAALGWGLGWREKSETVSE